MKLGDYISVLPFLLSYVVLWLCAHSLRQSGSNFNERARAYRIKVRVTFPSQQSDFGLAHAVVTCHSMPQIQILPYYNRSLLPLPCGCNAAW